MRGYYGWRAMHEGLKLLACGMPMFARLGMWFEKLLA